MAYMCNAGMNKECDACGACEKLENLEPCPHCGSTTYDALYVFTKDDNDIGKIVGCDDCMKQMF